MKSVVAFLLGVMSASPAFAGQNGNTALSEVTVPTSGACCLDYYTCIQTTEEDCTAQGGIWWFENTPCGWEPCLYVPGACCGEYGTCVETGWWSCVRYYPGYQFIRGETCDPNPCPGSARGACCLRDGTCELIPEEYLCTDFENGIWLGYDVPCSPDPCSPTSGTPGESGRSIRFFAEPNPFTTDVTFTLFAQGEGRLEIFDVAGRSVRRFALPDAGPSQLRWDGRDAQGTPVPAGIFLARVRQGEVSGTLHILKLR